MPEEPSLFSFQRPTGPMGDQHCGETLEGLGNAGCLLDPSKAWLGEDQEAQQPQF